MHTSQRRSKLAIRHARAHHIVDPAKVEGLVPVLAPQRRRRRDADHYITTTQLSAT